MEDNFLRDEFEEFLQEQVKNHRMYPGDSVWRSINKQLHPDKKWPALTLAAFALLTATIVISVYFTPKPNIFAINPAPQTDTQSQGSQKNNVLNKLTSSAAFSKEVAPTSSNNNPAVTPSVNNPFAGIKNNDLTFIQRSNKQVNTSTPAVVKQIKRLSASPSITVRANSAATELNGREEIAMAEVLTQEKTIQKNGKADNKPKPAISDYNDNNMVDNFLNDHQSDLSLFTKSKVKSVKNKFGLQLYVAPSVSYRRLVEDHSVMKEDDAGGPVGLNYVTDVNKAVRHKPSTGIEAGVSLLYNATKKFRIKAGLQFNMRQYSIEAYRSSSELASIALINRNGFDTVNTIAVYRNNNGFSSAELVNRYYQISVPIGIEWEIIGNKTVQLNIAGSIQPTYLVNHNAYLLSTNFKNYTQNADIVRRWNLNSSVETFISIKAGDFKWQIGPQVRYQSYSTFIPQYMIKEHLLDYGIKLGVTKTLN